MDVAIILFALVASGGEELHIPWQVFNAMLVGAGAAAVGWLVVWILPPLVADQLRPDLVALIEGHYSRGVSDTLAGGVVQLRGHSPN